MKLTHSLYSQKGELATGLTVLGLFFSVLGVIVGAGMSKNLQQSSSKAQTFFSYKSTLEIRDESGRVIDWEPDFTWDNGLPEGSGLTKGDIKTGSDPRAQVIFDATFAPGVPPFLQNKSTRVVIKIPQSYEAVRAFCDDVNGNTCAQTTVTKDLWTRKNTVITNGAEIQYGLVVKSKTDTSPTTQPTTPPTTQTPTSCPITAQECAPRNVQVKNITTKSIDVSWDISQSCTGYKAGSDFWIDVERQGEYIVCAAEGGSDGSKQCVLGKSSGITSGRQLNTNSEEFRKREWDENRKYIVKVFTHNASPSCVSPAGTASFTYATESKPDPVTPGPSGKLQCNKTCIYSEGAATNTRCYRGACPDNQPNCGGGIENINNGCVYAGGVCSGVHKEVDCKTGEDIGGGGGNQPSCISVGGTCMLGDNCSAEGGEVKSGLAGCSAKQVCCKLPEESKITPTTTTSPITPTEPVPTPDPEISNCKVIKRSPQSTETVVFLPVGFKDLNEVESYIAETILPSIGLTNLSHIKNRFNYLLYKAILEDRDEGVYNCQKKHNKSCDPKSDEAQTIVRDCNGSVAVILVKPNSSWGTYEGYTMGLGSKSFVVSDTRRLTYVHELSHALPGLLDEYQVSGATELSRESLNKYINDGTNCSPQMKDGACKWGSKGGCFKGCWYGTNLYRPSENSVMNFSDEEIKDGNQFNEPSMDAWNKYLATNNAFKVENSVDPIYKNALLLELAQNAPGEIELVKIGSRQTYPDLNAPLFSRLSNDYYMVTIIDQNGSTLYKSELPIYRQITHSNLPPELLKHLQVYLPYIDSANRVVVTDSADKILLSIDLSEHSIAPAVVTGNQCGNAVCDAELGETSISCRADCGEFLYKSELERSDLDGNGQVNGVDLFNVIDENVYQKTASGDVNGDLQTNALDTTLILKWLGTELNY